MTGKARWAGIVAVSFIWGSTWLAIKVGLGSMPPFLSAGMRFAIAAGILSALAWASGLPDSSVVTLAKSSRFASMRSAASSSTRPRWYAVRRDHSGNALSAESIAVKTSVASPNGTTSRTCSVAGLSRSQVPPLAASTHSPSMSCLKTLTLPSYQGRCPAHP